MPERRLFVCTNQKSGIGEAVAKALKKELKAQGVKTMLADGRKLHTRIQTCSCLDRCEHCKKGPGAALVVYPDEIYYNDVQPKDAACVVASLAASAKK
ncbi:(2Fe-2S) ferredoxin domain-containing protein [Hymenobacter sp. BRD67]|uniref:(2Fe-2S) ferredoxin domain-containing protein n=1 Tax=Hymenobacter sp. BRD67 TaxID=2675877 RepID=UPI00156712EE|nr:(2Fe-2S) ferredoxin domain-containing protein [Hymenobacter sp. BRD67]QKG53171.1 (2Fe-2S) ferredoxin domain-containing protein [Hymenobacter sp. BRD67]